MNLVYFSVCKSCAWWNSFKDTRCFYSDFRFVWLSFHKFSSTNLNRVSVFSAYIWIIDMNRSDKKKVRQPNPISKASFFSKLSFWWESVAIFVWEKNKSHEFLLNSINVLCILFRFLKPILLIGWKRPIEEDDIYAVTNSMRSDTNTEEFAKLWDVELTKKHPSILRVMLKLHGTTVFSLAILFSIGETLAK